MIKLETNYGYSFFDTTFYFHTQEDCDKFLYVFEDHWCNIRWKKPVEVSNDIRLTTHQKESLNRDPKERAESNLSWGFNLARYAGDDKLTPEQQAVLDKLMEEL